MLKIYGLSLSPFVRKTRVILAEKQLQYELIQANPFAPDEAFRKLTPFGKVPVMQVGDLILPDSTCIAAYLERCYPEPALYPKDNHEFGRALFFEEYGDSILYPTLISVFMQRVAMPKLMGLPTDENAVRDALAKTPPVLDFLESQVRDSSWIAGSDFSVADIALATSFANWGYAGEKVDPSRWPKLAAYLKRVHERPSFKALIQEDLAAFGG